MQAGAIVIFKHLNPIPALGLALFGALLLFPRNAISGWNDPLVITKYENTVPTASNGSSTNGKVPLGTSGRGDDTHVQPTSVILDGATYKMWYSGYASGNYRIYYATSSNGLEWTKYDNTIPAVSDGSSTNGKIPMGVNGSGDDGNAYFPSVIKDGSTYKMWYTGSDGANNRIYYATSSNGLEWTKYDNTVPAISDGSSTNGKIPLGNNGRGDDAGTTKPFVIKDGSTYKMWYTGYDGGNYRIYYATSSNGLEWTKYDNTVPAVSDGSSTNGKIPLGTSGRGDSNYAYYAYTIKDGSTYKMWYAGQDGGTTRVYYATSSNGLEWTKYDNTIPAVSDGSSTNGKIPIGSSGRGDVRNAYLPTVIKMGYTYMIWYEGNDGVNVRGYYASSAVIPPGTIITFR